jgi:hypothetical protein
MEVKIGRIDERTDYLVKETGRFIKWQNDQDKRIGRLESFRGWVIGVGAALAFVVGIIVKAL